MSEELYFNDELRKCLNAAGLSDCGENDAWNYWYHRVHKAHDQAVDRVTEAQRAENAKLREIIADLEELLPESGRWYSHETVKAISEDNAKLRKLLLDVWNDAMQFDGFWEYVHDDGKIYREDELPHYQERMRELGVDE